MASNVDLVNRRNQLYLILAVSAIILISSIAYMFTFRPEETSSGPAGDNFIGVIHINGAINSAQLTSLTVEAIDNARTNSSIKGLVLQIDSPGGLANLVEDIYFDLLDFKKTGKPLVAHIVTGLSGGYYIAVAADYIFTNPSSQVGNVGVIGTAPDSLIPSETSLETGPYKAVGYSKLLYHKSLSNALAAFTGAVIANREETLNLTTSTLQKGMIYLGLEAVKVGLVDEIGALQSAARKAAEEASITNYKLASLDYWATGVGLKTFYPHEGVSWRNLTIQTLIDLYPPPALYYLYLTSEGFMAASEIGSVVDFDPTIPVTYGQGNVIIDISHGNKISPLNFQLLAGELARRGVYTGYGDTWKEIAEGLDSAACLIVAAPTKAYSSEEFEIIDDWLLEGRVLVLLYDPSLEYNDRTQLTSPINSLANRYGLSFRTGYLYDMEDNYYGYRNIYVRTFRNTNITKDIDSLILLTSTGLLPTDSNAGYTSPLVYSTSTENQGIYIPLSVTEKGNTTLFAIGDISFLTEPYVYMEDNYQLMLNLVDAISRIDVPIIEPIEEPEYNITQPDLPIGTLKAFVEYADGEQTSVLWERTQSNETVWKFDGKFIKYYNNAEHETTGWEDNLKSVVYDDPIPDYPYPLTESKGWIYKVGYNMTWGGIEYRGEIEGGGKVDGFEEIIAGDGIKYACAKCLITEHETLSRLSDTLSIYVTQNVWISADVGIVKTETTATYYVDDSIADEISSTMLMTSIDLG